MKAYPLEAVENYGGSGYALAAISGGKVMALAYIRDIDDSLNTIELFIDELPPEHAILLIADSEKCAQAGIFFEEKGFTEVAFGLVSAGEFNLL